MLSIIDIDDAMAEPGFLDDPYPYWAQLRSTRPVCRARNGMWVLTGYREVEAALRDPRFSSQQARMHTRLRMLGQPAAESMERVFGRSMLHLDPPEHTRLRRVVNGSFSHRRIARMRPVIEHIVEGLIDEVAEDRTMDFVADFAYPLPVTVIFERFGIPFADRPALARLIRRHREGRLRLVSEQAREADADAPPVSSGSAALATMEQTAFELCEYLAALLRRKASAPEDDFLSELAHDGSVDADEQDGLDDAERIGTAMLLLIAGQETTINLLGNGMLALMRHPDQLQRVASDDSLISPAIEEMIRVDTPIQVVPRVLVADVEFGAQCILASSEILVVLAAANHDPDRFADPDRFDVSRTGNNHVGFGAGVHHCLGAHLARVEAEIAIRTLLRRCPNLSLSETRLHWRPNPFLRGLESLPLQF